MVPWYESVLLNKSPQTLGERLAQRIVYNKVSLTDAANAMGVSRSVLYRWFSGKEIYKHLRVIVQTYYDSLPAPDESLLWADRSTVEPYAAPPTSVPPK